MKEIEGRGGGWEEDISRGGSVLGLSNGLASHGRWELTDADCFNGAAGRRPVTRMSRRLGARNSETACAGGSRHGDAGDTLS